MTRERELDEQIERRARELDEIVGPPEILEIRN